MREFQQHEDLPWQSLARGDFSADERDASLSLVNLLFLLHLRAVVALATVTGAFRDGVFVFFSLVSNNSRYTPPNMNEECTDVMALFMRFVLVVCL